MNAKMPRELIGELLALGGQTIWMELDDAALHAVTASSVGAGLRAGSREQTEQHAASRVDFHQVTSHPANMEACGKAGECNACSDADSAVDEPDVQQHVLKLYVVNVFLQPQPWQ